MKFVTVAPENTNIEMVKDVGQIPYILATKFGVDAEYVACHFDMSGPNVEEIQGLNFHNIKEYFNNGSISGLVYIIKHAKKIDWLSIHHAGRRSITWAKVYKLLNPKGRVYLKLDMDFRSCDMYDNSLKERRRFTKNTEICDLITIETESVKKRIQPYAKKDIKILPNGFSRVPENLLNIEGERENCFINVSRLGTEQKATDILLEAFAKSSPYHDWNLKLIGTMEPSFKPFLNEYFQKHPELKGRVIIKGSITDRLKLYKEYCKAKLLVLPSRWESFAIVGVEAIYCGCNVLMSDKVPSASDISNHEKYGTILPADNTDAWAEAFINATRNTYSPEISKRISEYAAETFDWFKICEQLLNYMRSIGE